MLAIIAAIENDFEREFITQIYLTYYKKMRGKALFIIKDEHEADEIVQEAFVKLIEHVQSLMKIDPIKVPVYVMVTVKHISFNHWNARKKEKGTKGKDLNVLPDCPFPVAKQSYDQKRPHIYDKLCRFDRHHRRCFDLVGLYRCPGIY